MAHMLPIRDVMIDDLRLHTTNDEGMPRPRGEFVLYWMQTTHRVDDNYALAFATEQANVLRVPVLVYHELAATHPWASDRFHTFALQGVIDLYEAFEQLGIQYVFTLSPGPLLDLTARASLVVTDLYPMADARARLAALKQETRTPVVAVDSCTVVPLRYHHEEYETVRSIRPVLLRALPHYLQRLDYVEPRIRTPIQLPFEPVRPTDETIASLVAACAIDHSVPPVTAVRGGMKAARARIDRFLKHGFPRYLEARGDPNDEDGTSRLSPYLHYGHISMQEVLLALRQLDLPDQYEQFLDEALVWRELAHNCTFSSSRYRTIDGIPFWAAEELRRGEHDQRPVLYSAAELEGGQTEDELWNAAQQANIVDGWLHGAIRVLWGKAVLQWTPSVAECFRILVHLNNKYSLDGCDPGSYAGILWTLGKFDRPFYRRPIYGAVRYQSLKSARKRFDVRAYVQRYGFGGETLDASLSAEAS